MSSGGGGTTTIQQAELPSWLQDAAKENLTRARMTADIGYVPNYGLDVAAFSPMQTSAMQNTANAASAFGLGAPTDVMAGMPQATTNNLGFSGYSSGNMYDQALAQLEANRPEQYAAMQSLFVNPITGATSAPTMSNNISDIINSGGTYGDVYNAVSGNAGGDSNFDPGTQLTAQERYNQTRAMLDVAQKYPLLQALVPGGMFLTDRAQKYVWNAQNEATQPQGFFDFLLGRDGDVVLGNGPGVSGSGSLVTGNLSGTPTNIAPTTASTGGSGGYYSDSSGGTNPFSGNSYTPNYDFNPTSFSSSYGSGPSGDTATVGSGVSGLSGMGSAWI